MTEESVIRRDKSAPLEKAAAPAAAAADSSAIALPDDQLSALFDATNDGWAYIEAQQHGQFDAGGADHDGRTPLTVLDGYVAVARRDPNGPLARARRRRRGRRARSRLEPTRVTRPAFNPLGALDPAKGVLLPEAISAARSLHRALSLIQDGLIKRPCLHWEVGHVTQTSPDCNIMIVLHDGVWRLEITRDARANARLIDDDNYAAHTEHRNSYALGISVAGMWGTSPTNFGSDGVNLHETHLADDRVTTIDTYGEWNALTHAEVAVINLYANTRWDFGTIPPLSPEIERWSIEQQATVFPTRRCARSAAIHCGC